MVSKTAETGIFQMSEEDYQADRIADRPSLSASIAKILCAESPLHAWTAHPRLNPNFVREEREIFDLGTVSHALMLQGIQGASVLDYPDWKTKAAREDRDTLRAAGKVPILQKHWTRVQEMVKAGKAQIATYRGISEIFTDAGTPELTMTWVDDHGVICRSRMDWLRKDHRRICDYKGTGTSVNPAALSPKFVTSQGWDVQAAFYLRGLKAITGKDADFIFIAQEDYPPYALSAFGLHPESLVYGAKKVQWAIDTFAECLESGIWPAYTNKIISELPFDAFDAERWAWKESQ